LKEGLIFKKKRFSDSRITAGIGRPSKDKISVHRYLSESCLRNDSKSRVNRI